MYIYTIKEGKNKRDSEGFELDLNSLDSRTNRFKRANISQSRNPIRIRSARVLF